MPWPDQTASDQKHINGVTSCQSRLLNDWITWRDLYMAMANGISFQRVQNISVVRSSNIIIRLIARAAINYDWITFRWMILCRYCFPSQSIRKRSRAVWRYAIDLSAWAVTGLRIDLAETGVNWVGEKTKETTVKCFNSYVYYMHWNEFLKDYNLCHVIVQQNRREREKYYSNKIFK